MSTSTRIPRRLAMLTMAALTGLTSLAVAAPAQAAAARPSCIAAGTSYTPAATTRFSGNIYSNQTVHALHSPLDVAAHPSSHWDSNLISNEGHYMLAMQDDGNLVEYQISYTGEIRCGGDPNWYVTYYNYGAVWDSDSAFVYGTAPTEAVMQTDGNLVVSEYGEVLWASGSNYGTGIWQLALQDDSNLVIYSSGNAFWDRNNGDLY